jgi:pyruvate/2-oxoglutarate dehydrogenase complex dihydrolipoamide acyltransferase (E2) component
MSVPAELGEVCELAVKVGDYVKEDAVVAIIDTCKASIEARCRASGVVTHVLTR